MNNRISDPNAVAVAMLIVACLSAAASAQTPVDASDFERLRNRVEAGDTIVVTDSASRQSAGVLTALSESTVTLKLRGVERSIPMPDVREIAIKGDSVRNGALIGAGIAVGLTASIGASWCADYACSRPVVDTLAVSAITAALFGGVGALIDKAHAGHTVVFRGRQTQTFIRPLLGEHRLGLNLTLSR
jgi:hypothetical protein